MLRWFYPKDRDYSFTLWDFFVSLTLLVVYVAGYKALLLVFSWGHTCRVVYQHPQAIYFEAPETQYIFRTQQPQQLFVVVYRLEDRQQGAAMYQRIVTPLPPMTLGFLYYSTTLEYEVFPERNELRFNGQAVAMVKLESVRRDEFFGRINGRRTSGTFEDQVKYLLDSVPYHQSISSNHRYVPFENSYYVVHIMNEQALDAAPEQVILPLTPAASIQ